MRGFLAHTALAACALLLSGCFVAEDDDANPIIPVASEAYPLKVGAAKECEERGEDEESCKRAEIVRLGRGGYELQTWDADAAADAEPSRQSYRMRALKGKGIPADTYLVQSIKSNANERTLGMMIRRPDGAWIQVSPQCEDLRPASFVAFMTDGWIQTESPQLSSMRCEILRAGLTDERLYAILDSTKKPTYPKLIFDGL